MHKLAVILAISIVACGGQPKPVPVAPAQDPVVEIPAGCRDNVGMDEEGNLIVTGTWRGKPVKILVDTGANGGSIAAELVKANALPVKGQAKYASATEPMRIGGDSRNRDIVVSARFGAKTLDNMILDTGAGVTCVNQDLVPGLAHTELPEKAQAVDGTGQVVELPLVSVPEMCVAQKCVTDHTVMPSEDLTPLVGHQVDGIVGLPFFLTHVLVLDFPAQKIGIQ